MTADSIGQEASALARFSAAVATQALSHRAIDAHDTNAALADAGANDLSGGCLAWRQASNAVRLVHGDHDDVLDTMSRGRLVATSFNPRATTMERHRSRLRVSGAGLLTTGFRFASHLLVEARSDEGPTVILIDANEITCVHRPEFIGLQDADNAVVSFDTTVPAAAIVGQVGRAEAIVEAPYRAGLTMGAVAIGGARAVLELYAAESGRRSCDEDLARLGRCAARVAAAWSLVGAASAHAPDAQWWSRAAKLAATSAALDACDGVGRLVGPAAYRAHHPLNQLRRDLRGIAFQAPTDPGAAVAVGRALLASKSPSVGSPWSA
jgi:alkylation response protein AidB-like acyl-CoA dehydrogenase